MEQLRSLSMVTAIFVASQMHGVAAQAKKSADLPPQEILDVLFPKDSTPPLMISLTRPENSKPDPLCGLAPADLTESRDPKTRVYKILIKAPDNDPLNPSEAFLRVSRFTVDADGSSRAYHPKDPLGVGICEPGKSEACALDELPNADVRLFRGAKEIDPHNSDEDRTDYLTTWAEAWSLITAKSNVALDHQADPRIPEDYALYYFKDLDLIVVFKTSIIPFRDGSPCMRRPKLADPGYFVAATAFKKTRVSPATVCDPGHYIDSSKVPFFVIPGDTFGKLNTGDLVVGFAQSESGNRLVFGIVGDKGPFYKTAEASIAFNSKILRRTAPLKNSIDQDAIDIELGTDHITAMGVLVLGGTASAFRGDFSAGNIAAVGEGLLKRWSRGRTPIERLTDCINAGPPNSWK